VTDPLTGAVQAPGCDLNDFNVPGSPANGTWTLTVNDVCNMDTGVLHNFSLHFANGTQACLSCEAEGGQFDTSAAAVICPAYPVQLENLSPVFPNGTMSDSTQYGYTYVIVQQDTLLAVTDQPDLGQYPAGTYQVYGLSYHLSDSVRLPELPGLPLAGALQLLGAPTETFCADLTDNCLTFELLPDLAPTYIDTVLCEGQCLLVGEAWVCGSDTMRLQTASGCDSLVIVRLTLSPPDTSFREETVCPGAWVTVGDTVIQTPGIHTITLSNELGCDSMVILRLDTVAVSAVLSGPDTAVLTCTHPEVAFDAGHSTGDWLVWNGLQGPVGSGTGFSTGAAGIYQLVATASTAGITCHDTLSVVVTDSLVPPQLVVENLVTLCEGEGKDLAGLLVANEGGPFMSLTYHSDFPPSDSNELSDSYVQPDQNSTYYLFAAAGACSHTVPVTVSVQHIPAYGFELDAPVCIGDTAYVTCFGTADAEEIWDWSTGGGVTWFSNGILRGLVWSQAGTFAVSATVTSGGCPPVGLDTQWVEVESPPAMPVIGCTATTESVTWAWEPDPGAEGYAVALAGGDAVQAEGNQYTVGGLSPGDSLTMVLTAFGSASCGNVTVASTCAALPCPAMGLQLAAPADICRSETAVPFQIPASLTGADVAPGVWAWSGSGIVPNSDGWFDPHLAAEGVNQITVTFTMANCSYVAQQEIAVHEVPELAFSIASPLCQGEEGMIEVTASAGGDTEWTWVVGGATVLTGDDGLPQALSWPASGLYEVSCTVSSGNCPSLTVQEAVVVEAPVSPPGYSCESTTEAVIFGWDPVPGAAGYEVTVMGGVEGVHVDSTSYGVGGLAPGTAVVLSVTASGSYACGAPTWEQTCSTLPCPVRTMEILSPGQVCLDQTTGSMSLEAVVSGDPGEDNRVWYGVGISDSETGLWDPVAAGPGVHTVSLVVSSGNCADTAFGTISVAIRPEADAGPDQSFDCRTGPVAQLGGATYPAGGPYRYEWSATGKAFPGNPIVSRPVVQAAGDFLLTVTDTVSGCQAVDEVTVTDLRSDPVPVLDMSPTSCHGAADGEIRVDTVMPGIPPFLYTLDGGSNYRVDPVFTGLAPGLYELTVLDSAGCEGGYAVEIAEGDSLWVTLKAEDPSRPFIRSGERIRLAAEVSMPLLVLDDIRWTPSEVLDCGDCLEPVATLYRTTTLDLSVAAGGCTATAAITVYVDRRDPLYVPTAFTPNGDATNDAFRLYAGPDIGQIESLQVFDRWGEQVFVCQDFLPSEESCAWDGTFRGGAPLDAGVFIWTVVVVRQDGSRERFSGEVNLIR
jgi:gliding motility-associated-like protein